jgi:hypothetical protein
VFHAIDSRSHAAHTFARPTRQAVLTRSCPCRPRLASGCGPKAPPWRSGTGRCCHYHPALRAAGRHLAGASTHVPDRLGAGVSSRWPLVTAANRDEFGRALDGAAQPLDQQCRLPTSGRGHADGRVAPGWA